MDIGTDNGLPVVPKLEYAKILPKYFRGTIEKVEFDLGPAKISQRSATDLSSTLRQGSSKLVSFKLTLAQSKIGKRKWPATDAKQRPGFPIE